VETARAPEHGNGTRRVLIADGQRLLVEALSLSLAGSGLEILCADGDGSEVRSIAERWSPDIVLLGRRLGGADGLEVGRELLEMRSEPTVLILVDPEEPTTLRDVRHSRLGYLPLDTPKARLISIVHAALDGKTILTRPPSATTPATLSGEERDAYRAVRSLTTRERDVLTLLAEGASNKRIAEILHITLNTASAHVRNIFTKLQVHSRVEALLFVMRFGAGKPPNGRMRSLA
jgi:DNA-binding NarL/FixJ family response regulator